MPARWLPEPRYTPCDDCGASVERADVTSHVCDRERRLDFQMFQLREEVAGFEGELRAYLDSPAGRFEVFYARSRRR